MSGPLAFRRSAAALAPATERQDSIRAALRAITSEGVAFADCVTALKRCTSHPGRSAGGVVARTARERE